MGARAILTAAAGAARTAAPTVEAGVIGFTLRLVVRTRSADAVAARKVAFRAARAFLLSAHSGRRFTSKAPWTMRDSSGCPIGYASGIAIVPTVAEETAMLLGRAV